MKNCYDVLGIAPSASKQEIKQAYRKMAMKTHPDLSKSDNASDGFIEIKTAYETLIDPVQRLIHDERLSLNSSSDLYRPYPFSHSHTSHTSQTYTSSTTQTSSFNQYTGTSRKKSVERISVTLTDSYLGRFIIVNNNGKDGQIKLPPGVRSGTKLFANDTLYHIEVLSDKKFKRNNDDLMVDVTINCIDAMLGVEVSILHMDGRYVKAKIPPGVQYGQSVCVMNEGMPNPEFDRRGHLFVKCLITTLTDLTADQRSSIIKLQASSLIIV